MEEERTTVDELNDNIVILTEAVQELTEVIGVLLSMTCFPIGSAALYKGKLA